MNFIKKYWYIILIAAVVITGGVIFVTTDPFGIIPNSKNAVLKKTNIIIKEIKSIGEFSTAKYYGESLQSLKFIKIADNKSEFERTYNQVSRIYLHIKETDSNGINDPVFPDGKPKSKLAFRILNDWRYKDMIHTARYRMLKEILGYVIDLNMLEKIAKTTYAETYKNNEEKINKRLKDYTEWKLKYVDLVCIGRGYVKAGYNLSDNSSDIKYSINLEKNEIIISNVTPEIFDPVINPWFDEANHIKGFEVVFTKWAGSIDDEKFNLVVSECKRSLLIDAKKRNIENQAKENAEAFLTQYLKYITKKPDLKVTIIHRKTA
jgi:hypothetical protein